MVDNQTPYLAATIIPFCGGSAIVGEFRRRKVQIIFNYTFRILISVFLLGGAAFVAYGVYRDPSSDFTPSVAGFLCGITLTWAIVETLLRKYGRISPEAMLVVSEFIERAMRGALNQNTEQVGGCDGEKPAS